MDRIQPVEAMTLELRAASPDLVGNHDLLRGILSGSGDCIKILDLDGRLQFMSEGGKRVMEVEDFSALKGCPWPDFWSGEGNAQASAAIVAAKEGRVARFQNAANTAKGTPRFWDVQVSPITGPDGKPTHLLSISRDITEEWKAREAERAALEKQTFLAAELTHRVKNTLATVAGIASQTFRDPAYKAGRDIFNARLQSMSMAYNILTEAAWAGSDVRAVVEGALAPYRTEDQFSIDGPTLEISSGRALTLALALNELATNAVKYGALSLPAGRIAIFWHREPAEAGRDFTFVWKETGGPAVTSPTRTGFGSKLIKSVLAQEFGGTVSLQYEPSGLVCTLQGTLA